MDEYWPNLTCKQGSGNSCDTFWKHEFQKHGTCAKSMDCLDTDTEYFQNTVKFFKQLEVDRKTFKSSFFKSLLILCNPTDTSRITSTTNNGSLKISIVKKWLRK